MSNYNSERGAIQFTKTGYMEVVRKFREKHNLFIDYLYDWSLALHSLIISHSPKLKQDELNFSCNNNARYPNGFIEFLCNNEASFKGAPFKPEKWMTIDSDLIYMVCNEIFRGAKQAACKPRKSTFKKLTNKNTVFSLDADCALITFDSKNQSIAWHVEENNHAVESSHKHAFARLLFSILNSYNWKRKEGGIIKYYDEYMREYLSSPSITYSFGPLGEDQKKFASFTSF